MSIEENNPPQETSKLSQAVGDAIPTPVPDKEFKYLDEHTPSNTPVNQYVDPVVQTKRELEEVDRESGFSTVYMGTSKADIERVQELVGRWLAVESVRQLNKKGRASESLVHSVENEWNQFLETSYAGVGKEEIENRAASFYRFFEGVQDDILTRTRIPLEKATNLTRYSSKLTMAEIIARVPNASTEGFGIAEIMARSTSNDTGTAHKYGVLLRNSFTYIEFARGSKHNLGDVVNDINATVRGYVRQVGNNTLTLASIAGMKAVWEWFHPRILSCSTKGIVDFKDLINVISIKDFFTLCNAILASATDDGIGMDLRCINPSCGHGSYELIDPTKLTNVRPGIQTDAEAAIFGNLVNGRVNYDVDQVLALIRQSTYGLETNYVYSASRNIRLTIRPPSMADAFVTFDYFVGQVDPRLARIRSKIVNEDQLQDQIAIELNRLGASEYIHYVDEYTILPPEGKEGEPIVIRRSESNPDEFNKGLMTALERDEVLNSNLTKFIFLKTPYMTRTFSGIRNHVCPKCGHGSSQDGDRQLGYTPIDSFMTFFTHTQMTIMAEAVKRQVEVKEALSQ